MQNEKTVINKKTNFDRTSHGTVYDEIFLIKGRDNTLINKRKR